MTERDYFASPAFREQFHCSLPLGAFCGPEGTVFRLWAPTASEVALHLYDCGAGEGLLETALLPRGEQGVWSYQTRRNLDGVYYDYEVTVDGVRRRTADPYARACGLNGLRSMVLDLRRTDPPGWEEDRPPAKPPEDIIYELHVKDFSWDPSSGVLPSDRGTYKALCQADTTLHGDGVHPTGLAWLRRLGVTHVQLMPVYDFGSVDEGGDPGQFNWGYDPVNYNVPEGSYATDAAHGEVRVRELKEAVQSLHRSGFRVIMDVVYNHTYQLDSWLWRTVPWYYYRQRPDGSSSNGSGCGNELATERSMCARYILDSVLYWAEEYHMDGFRFDLMGALDAALMNRIQEALDDRFGPGEKQVYGEPWPGGETAAPAGTALCTKENLHLLNPAIGAFCDATRDAIKGGVSEPGAAGFVNGGAFSAAWLARCIQGWTGEPFQSPAQTITYLSCHDDWTLWDKLVLTLDRRKRFGGRQLSVLRANRLAAAMNFCCQGHVFFLSGEEFGRTKQGVKNSYCSPLEINRMDWDRAWKNKTLAEYYRGLIALRKQLPGLCDKSPGASQRLQEVLEPEPGCAVLVLDNSGGDCLWKRLCLLFNVNRQVVELPLPPGDWQLLADGRDSFQWQKNKTATGSVRLTPVSAMILGEVGHGGQ